MLRGEGGQPRWFRRVRFAWDPPTPRADTSNKSNLLLLVQLRWLAVGGQILTILLVSQWLQVDLKLISMQAGVFGRGFTARFAPATFVLAILTAVGAGAILL